MSLVLSRRGPILEADHHETVAAHARKYRDRHHTKLEGLIEPELLQYIVDRLAGADFVERVHEGIDANREFCMSHNALAGHLHFLFNDQRLFSVIEAITGCRPIGSFGGRVYRFDPAEGHHDAWHDDLDGRRMVAMSLNLGGTFEGGILEIRDAQSQIVLQRIENTELGDAVIFRLDPALEHRVTPVVGTRPRTAFAGWFQTEPTGTEVLQELRRDRQTS